MEVKRIVHAGRVPKPRVGKWGWEPRFAITTYEPHRTEAGIWRWKFKERGDRFSIAEMEKRPDLFAHLTYGGLHNKLLTAEEIVEAESSHVSQKDLEKFLERLVNTHLSPNT
jgi:hypothetical protein